VSGQLDVPAALPPGKEPLEHQMGGWVDRRAGLDDMEKSSPYTVAIPTELPRLTKKGKTYDIGF
jgi:hypothetical protein